MASKVIYTRTIGGSNTLRMRLRGNQEYLDLFHPPDRKRILQYGLLKGGEAWRKKYLRLRFKPGAVTAPPWNYKVDIRTPLVESGDLERAIYTGRILASVEMALNGPVKCGTKVFLPTSHAITREISRVLKIYPENEVQYWADTVMRVVVGQFAEVQGNMQGSKSSPNSKIKLRLSRRQRNKFKRYRQKVSRR